MGYVALSVPFMIVNFLIGMWIMEISTSGIATDQKIITIYVIYDAPVIILAAIVLIVVHELIHLLFIPNFIKSDNTYIGFTYFGGYVYTKEAPVSYTHLRAHETDSYLVCRLLLEKKKKKIKTNK